MKNIFSDISEKTKIISDWLSYKMNLQFKEGINLSQAYIIDIIGSGLVLPTEDESNLNEGQKSYLNTLCRMINNQNISFEEMNQEVLFDKE